MILLTKYAEQRGKKADTVSAYIRRNKELFEEHVKVQGKSMVLDDEAVRILDEIYPLPRPVEVIEDTESRKALIEAQQTIIKLQAMLNAAERTNGELKGKLAESEAIKLLLDDKERLLTEKNKELEDLREKSDELLEKSYAAAAKEKETEIQLKVAVEKCQEYETEMKKYKKTIFGLYKKIDD